MSYQEVRASSTLTFLDTCGCAGVRQDAVRRTLYSHSRLTSGLTEKPDLAALCRNPADRHHNNHHAFEYSAAHGLEWWEVGCHRVSVVYTCRRTHWYTRGNAWLPLRADSSVATLVTKVRCADVSSALRRPRLHAWAKSIKHAAVHTARISLHMA